MGWDSQQRVLELVVQFQNSTLMTQGIKDLSADAQKLGQSAAAVLSDGRSRFENLEEMLDDVARVLVDQDSHELQTEARQRSKGSLEGALKVASPPHDC